MQRIAIIQTGFIGDAILALSLARLTRQAYPSAHIHFVCRPDVAELVELCEDIDGVIVYRKRDAHSGFAGLLALAQTLKSKRVDTILSPHRSARTSLVAYLSKAATRVAFSRSALSLLYTHKIAYQSNVHETERNADLLRALGHHISIGEAAQAPVMLGMKESPDSWDTGSEQFPNGYVILAPGSVWATKRWTEQGFVQLARYFAGRTIGVLLSGGPDDVGLCDRISQQTGARSLAGQASLRDSLNVFKGAKLVVCNDSAATHLSWLAKTPTVTLYGPTSTAYGFGPLAAQSTAISLGLKCSPCRIHGSNTCPIGTHACMNDLSAARVINAIESLGVL